MEFTYAKTHDGLEATMRLMAALIQMKHRRQLDEGLESRSEGLLSLATGSGGCDRSQLDQRSEPTKAVKAVASAVALFVSGEIRHHFALRLFQDRFNFRASPITHDFPSIFLYRRSSSASSILS